MAPWGSTSRSARVAETSERASWRNALRVVVPSRANGFPGCGATSALSPRSAIQARALHQLRYIAAPVQMEHLSLTGGVTAMSPAAASK